MLNLHDDSYEQERYSCCECEEKDYLLREATAELIKVMGSVVELKKSHSEIEDRLLNNLESACHMMGIPFRW